MDKIIRQLIYGPQFEMTDKCFQMPAIEVVGTGFHIFAREKRFQCRFDCFPSDGLSRADLASFESHSSRVLLGERFRSDRGARTREPVKQVVGARGAVAQGSHVVAAGKIDHVRLLVYRESRGMEVRYPAFLRQFSGAALEKDRLSKPKLGHLKKHDVGPHKHLVELRDFTGATEGEAVTVELFEPGDRVKVSGVSIDKGFAGTIKRHNFSRGPTTHGSHNIRKPGSVGASATPSRVFKGIKMAGRMGGKRVTQVGLTVHAVEPERNLLLVKGAVPGPRNGLVEVREEVRRGGS